VTLSTAVRSRSTCSPSNTVAETGEVDGDESAGVAAGGFDTEGWSDEDEDEDVEGDEEVEEARGRVGPTGAPKIRGGRRASTATAASTATTTIAAEPAIHGADDRAATGAGA
jgi:hypothetical protein